MYAAVCRTLLVDSGASHHLISDETLSEAEIAKVRPCKPIKMQTANGDLTVDKETEVYIKDLNITVRAKLLPRTTSVLSMGKLVKDHYFKVTWTRDDGAIIEKGKINCSVKKIKMYHNFNSVNNPNNLLFPVGVSKKLNPIHSRLKTCKRLNLKNILHK